MYKEIIISIGIIGIVIIADCLTQTYTKKSVNKLSSELDILRKYLIEENENGSKEQAQKVNDSLEKIHSNLAYFIEHDEIEKIETNFTACKSFVNSQSYDLAINELEKTIFVLNHLTDKNSFNLENIF